MRTDRYYHFEDDMTFKSIPFIVEVYDETHYWRRYDTKPPCKRRVAKIQPDYRYEVEEEWPSGAEKSFSDIVWYERPKKKHWLLKPVDLKSTWKKVEQEPEKTVKEQVETVTERLVAEWNEHANPDGFADVGLNKPNL